MKSSKPSVFASTSEVRPQALLEHNLNPILVEWYYNYLTHRNLYTEHNGKTATATIKFGFPQGGVCSAKFWIIAFNKAIDIINQYVALGIGFADDCCILLHRGNNNHAISLIQRIADQLVSWGNTMGLTFNPTKTICILFTRASKKTITYPRQKLRINGSEVEFSTNTRYLGVQIDSKLNWNLHFDNITRKAKSYIMCMIGSLYKRWGPKPPLIRWLYISVIRPRISYGCVTWAHTITTLREKKRLEKINRLASLMTVPVRQGTPTMAMEIINNYVPLELHLDEIGLNTFCRLKLATHTSWIQDNRRKKLKFTPHLKHWLTMSSDALGHQEDEESIFEHIDQKTYTIKIDNIKGRKKPTTSEINIYTDGSKTKLGAGSGYVILGNKNRVIHTQSINLPSTATIFQADLIAI